MEPLQNQKIRRRSESAVHEPVEARAAALPSREEVIAYIGGAPAPNGERAPPRVTKRDIARAFGVKGDAKAELKLLIKDLQAEGAVAHGRKALTVEGRLPSLVVADIAEKDRYGELIAKPVEWIGEEPEPRILVRRPSVKRDRAPAPGVGARVLMRVDFDPGSGAKSPAYSGRVVKILDKMRARTFAVYRSAADGSGRASPVEKRAAGREYVIPAGMAGEARDGDLVAIEPLREGRLGLPPARVVETIGSVKSERAVSLIALEMHHIPHVFSPATLKEAEDARPVRLSAPREDWRKLPLVTIDPPDAKDHDDAVHAVLDSDPANSGGFSSPSPSPTSPLMFNLAWRWIEKRSSAATRSISPTGSFRCCRSASPTTSARCARTRTGPRSRCAWSLAPTVASARTSFTAS